MYHLMDVRQEKILSWTVTVTFLLIHILLLVMFSACGVTPMAWFNVFSISFYLAMFFVIQRQWFRFFVVATYLEVLVHMTLAVLFTGWNNGFQITLIGICVFAFFAEFLERCMKVANIRAVPLCVLGAICYLVSLVICHNREPLYPLPGSLSYGLQISWTVITFGINIVSLWGFTMISFHADQLLSLQARTDALTGLPNRLLAARTGLDFMREGGWLAILDVDDFKLVNDTYGHNFGDEVLVTVASLMRENASEAIIFRWGGEEFLLMGHAEDPVSAQILLDNLRHAVERHEFRSGDERVQVTVTVGLASYAGEAELTEWINLADKKLYLGKRSGKNQVVQ